MLSWGVLFLLYLLSGAMPAALLALLSVSSATLLRLGDWWPGDDDDDPGEYFPEGPFSPQGEKPVSKKRKSIVKTC
jgi:hypothetical protein